MGKRSDFEKIPKDFYPTVDPRAVVPLIPFVRGKTYAEPCYGEGDLEDLLADVATCKWRSDVRVTVGSSTVVDALSLTKEQLSGIDLIITNPPFSRSTLLPLLDHCISLKPTWFLLPADYMHNNYFGPYMKKCQKIVSIGRLKWFKDSEASSTDNFAWYFWPKGATNETTVFYGR